MHKLATQYTYRHGADGVGDHGALAGGDVKGDVHAGDGGQDVAAGNNKRGRSCGVSSGASIRQQQQQQ